MVDVKEKTEVKTATKKRTTKKESVENKAMEEFMKELEKLKKQNEELMKQINKQNDDSEVVVEKPKKKAKVSLKDIRDEEVTVQRVVGGIGSVKFIDGKTGDEYLWSEIGDTEIVTVEVLKRMSSKSSMFLKTPWLKIIDNDDVVDALGLKSLYEALELVEDVDRVMNMSDSEIRNLISKLSQGYKETMAINLQTKINLGELTNITTIRKFERLLEKEFVL